MIIIDLDDTIFETKTMNPEVFKDSLSIIRKYYFREPDEKIDQILKELCEIPIDSVFKKYKTPQLIIQDFYRAISKMDYKSLNIKPFEDYKIFKNIEMSKILVTTGLKELQLAKISALGISGDFESIFIDDPRMNPRNSKLKIFKRILLESNLKAQSIWVIGDNPNSEISAGHELGMNTIQRSSDSKPR